MNNLESRNGPSETGAAKVAPGTRNIFNTGRVDSVLKLKTRIKGNGTKAASSSSEAPIKVKPAKLSATAARSATAVRSASAARVSVAADKPGAVGDAKDVDYSSLYQVPEPGRPIYEGSRRIDKSEQSLNGESGPVIDEAVRISDKTRDFRVAARSDATDRRSAKAPENADIENADKGLFGRRKKNRSAVYGDEYDVENGVARVASMQIPEEENVKIYPRRERRVLKDVGEPGDTIETPVPVAGSVAALPEHTFHVPRESLPPLENRRPAGRPMSKSAKRRMLEDRLGLEIPDTKTLDTILANQDDDNSESLSLMFGEEEAEVHVISPVVQVPRHQFGRRRITYEQARSMTPLTLPPAGLSFDPPKKGRKRRGKNKRNPFDY